MGWGTVLLLFDQRVTRRPTADDQRDDGIDPIHDAGRTPDTIMCRVVLAAEQPLGAYRLASKPPKPCAHQLFWQTPPPPSPNAAALLAGCFHPALLPGALLRALPPVVHATPPQEAVGAEPMLHCPPRRLDLPPSRHISREQAGAVLVPGLEIGIEPAESNSRGDSAAAVKVSGGGYMAGRHAAAQRHHPGSRGAARPKACQHGPRLQ
jgi:hypothetical protein